jgi:hypothetical protein
MALVGRPVSVASVKSSLTIVPMASSAAMLAPEASNRASVAHDRDRDRPRRRPRRERQSPEHRQIVFGSRRRAQQQRPAADDRSGIETDIVHDVQLPETGGIPFRGRPTASSRTDRPALAQGMYHRYRWCRPIGARRQPGGDIDDAAASSTVNVTLFSAACPGRSPDAPRRHAACVRGQRGVAPPSEGQPAAGRRPASRAPRLRQRSDTDRPAGDNTVAGLCPESSGSSDLYNEPGPSQRTSRPCHRRPPRER